MIGKITPFSTSRKGEIATEQEDGREGGGEEIADGLKVKCECERVEGLIGHFIVQG